MIRVALAGVLMAAPATAQTGDPVAGKTVANKCLVCHALEVGKNKIGPSLSGVIGRKAGTVAGFNYSPAMKASMCISFRL